MAADLSLTGARWRLADADPATVASLALALGVHPLLAAVLTARGKGTPMAARAFLRPGLDDLLDPMQMRGMEAAVARVRRAVARGERVRIFSDYDVDGTTSALTLRATLDALGLQGVDHRVPSRFGEGYGLSVAAVEEAAAQGVQLLLAADLGVSDHVAAARARALGVDLLICDHHLVGEEGVPRAAAAVLCPGQPGCGYPNRALAACGVAFKLAQALLADHPRRDVLLRSLLKVVALGTVADVVDLGAPENRAIVALGLEGLSAGPHAPGLRSLLEAAGCADRAVSATDLAFRVGPRVNAAGRLADAALALDLLLSRDRAQAKLLAVKLEGLNRSRQRLQEQLVERAMARALPDGPGSPPRCAAFPVFAGAEDEGWHRGVIGIVAGKLREALGRPVAVAAIAEGVATGSVRSAARVHALKALASAAPLLTRFGGHAAAAGFALPAERLPDLERALSRYLEEAVPLEARVPEREADALVQAVALDSAAARALEALEPTGRGNPRARLLVPGVHVPRVRRVRRHIFFDLGAIGAVWWGAADHAPDLYAGPVDLLGSLGPDRESGLEKPLFTVADARRA
ncbi:MAG: single-stranded-DNA-specific exonuclease RecJ [Pseudomonadota bacterium]